NVTNNVTIKSNSYAPPPRDPNRFAGLSPEEIVRMLMMELSEDADGAMVAQAHALKAAQERQLEMQKKKASGGEVSQADETKAEQDVTRMQAELQNIMEKRKQTFDLLSNFTANQHEMAKTALGNIGRI
ncbi:MAG: hypothetical protein ACK4N5_01320, partial [Myxococcales bacterium]